MTTLNEEQQRIRGYLQAQAAKLSIADLVEKVGTDQLQVRAAADAVPAGRFFDRPADGEWSANEVMAHIVESAATVAAGIAHAIDGVAPPSMTDRIRSEPERRTAADWWADLVRTRDVLFDKVGRASGDEHLDIRWQHPFFGPLNWREWLLFLRIHDLDHARQMQAITEALPATSA